MMKSLRHLSSLALIIMMGILAGILARNLLETDVSANTHNPVIASPLPDSLEDLIDSADLIVVGKIGEVVNQEMVYGYDKDAEHLAELDKQTSAQLGLPMSDYEVVIEEVISGKAVTQANGHLLYRLAGVHDPEIRDNDFIAQGDTKLLFLSLNPDGKTYGINSFINMMDINGSSISYFYEGKDLIPYDARNSSDFLSDVRELASSK